MKRFDIISPDGFPIDREATYTEEEIPKAIKEFTERYKSQGYYSSTNYGIIPLEDLKAYCTIKKINE